MGVAGRRVRWTAARVGDGPAHGRPKPLDVLSLGPEIEVLTPVMLRLEVAEAARRTAARYADAPSSL